MANQIVLDKVSSVCPLYTVLAPASVANGHIVVLGTRASDGTYACAANGAATDKEMVIILENPLSYEAELTQNEFVINTGDEVRAYQPYIGMVISIPQANITATAALAVDKHVVPKVSVTQMECLASAVGTESIIWNIDELYTKAGVAMCKIRCIKAT